MPDIKQDRSLGELFGELAQEMGALVRQEVALARVELTHKATDVGKNVGYLAAGGAVAYGAFLSLLAAAVLLLAQAMPAWAAALVVAVVVGVAGAVLVSSALSKLKRTDVVPHQTVQTLKEDAQWAKDQMKS